LIVGVLALQGDFREHLLAFQELGVRVREVRRPEELEGLAALVLPGGESTTIGRLMEEGGLLRAVRERAEGGLALFGTCAGLVLLAREIEGEAVLESRPQPRLGLMDLTVRRNAYGRQRESFEADLRIPALGERSFRGVFIRAPEVIRTGEGVEVLAWYRDRPVLCRQGRILAASFHPELADDLRLHRYFLEVVAS
jgi:5'-phosphate synthase pdxT subunit